MNFIMQIFGLPLGYVMWALYRFIKSYGISLVLFTLIIKLVLVPISIKQQRSSIKMQILQPKIQEIQNKYRNNPRRMNDELQALYSRENYSTTAGCLPMLLQFAILFGLMDVVYRPLTHLLRISSEVLTPMVDVLTANGVTFTNYTKEIVLLRNVLQNPGWFSSFSSEIINQISSLNMSFLGLDFSLIPNQIITKSPATWLTPYIIIPIVSGLTAMLTSLITVRNMPTSAAAAGTKSMMYIMPLFSLFFSFSVPTGIGFYWALSNLFGAIQSLLMFKFLNPAEMAEKARQEDEARKAQEREAKLEAKKRAKETGEKTDESLSQKELNRRKLAEARRRNAEKYGDEYVEVTDNDLK